MDEADFIRQFLSVQPFILTNKKRLRERGMWLKKSGGQWEEWSWIAMASKYGCEVDIVYCWRTVDGV